PASGDADAHSEERVPDDGRQPRGFVRLASLGARAAEQPDRRSLRDLLAADQDLLPLMRSAAALVAALGLCAACSGGDTDTHIYRVPSSSMEPTLHCARPGIGCEAKTDDLVAVHPFGNRRPQRGDIVVFHTPALAKLKCGTGGIFIKRVVGLPGEQ